MNKAAQPHYCKLDTKMPGKKSSSTAGKKTKGGKSKSNAAAAVVSQAAQWTHPHSVTSVGEGQSRYAINTWILENFMD